MKKSFTAQLGTAVFSKALVWGPQEIKVWVFFFSFFFYSGTELASCNQTTD